MAAPATQTKPPAGMGVPGETGVSSLTILEATQDMNKNFDEFKEQAMQTRCMLAVLSKAVLQQCWRDEGLQRKSDREKQDEHLEGESEQTSDGDACVNAD